MKINFSKIFFIVSVSIIISLIYNHFNPKGLNLIRKEIDLSWEIDSLTISETKDSLIINSDLTENKSEISPALIETKIETNKNEDNITYLKAIKLDLAYKLFKQKNIFIDSRSPEEYAEGHIKDAVNIPFYGSENYTKTINRLNKNDLVVIYCSGADCDIAELSAEELQEKGFKKIYVFVGGFEEWTKKNYPISSNPL